MNQEGFIQSFLLIHDDFSFCNLFQLCEELMMSAACTLSSLIPYNIFLIDKCLKHCNNAVYKESG